MATCNQQGPPLMIAPLSISGGNMVIQGTTSASAAVHVNGVPAAVSRDGRFQVIVARSVWMSTVVRATDAHGCREWRLADVLVTSASPRAH